MAPGLSRHLHSFISYIMTLHLYRNHYEFSGDALYFLSTRTKEWVNEALREVVIIAVVYSLSHVKLLWDSMGCGPPGSIVYGTSQARILQWVAISFSRGDLRRRDQTHIYCIGWWVFTTETPGKPIKGEDTCKLMWTSNEFWRDSHKYW